jgi:chaperonin cofactor prefoldin
MTNYEKACLLANELLEDDAKANPQLASLNQQKETIKKQIDILNKQKEAMNEKLANIISQIAKLGGDVA